MAVPAVRAACAVHAAASQLATVDRVQQGAAGAGGGAGANASPKVQLAGDVGQLDRGCIRIRSSSAQGEYVAVVATGAVEDGGDGADDGAASAGAGDGELGGHRGVDRCDVEHEGGSVSSEVATLGLE